MRSLKLFWLSLLPLLVLSVAITTSRPARADNYGEMHNANVSVDYSQALGGWSVYVSGFYAPPTGVSSSDVYVVVYVRPASTGTWDYIGQSGINPFSGYWSALGATYSSNYPISAAPPYDVAVYVYTGDYELLYELDLGQHTVIDRVKEKSKE
jgi:hypothetical protein